MSCLDPSAWMDLVASACKRIKCSPTPDQAMLVLPCLWWPLDAHGPDLLRAVILSISAVGEQSIQLAAASFCAATLLALPASAGVVLAQPELKKVICGSTSLQHS